MSDYPIRPQTPQTILHRLPDKPDFSSRGNTKPSKYIILILASTTVAGKVQIAKSVSNALSCPLFQGDSLHETSAKAVSVGAPKRLPTGTADDDEQAATTVSGANEARYQRMWLSKMTRTGLLFPEESRPANEDDKLRKANPASMTVTHPDLEKWHRDSIRKAVGEYGIGVIFVPLYEDKELPVLKPLDPKTMTSFASLGSSIGTVQKAAGASLDEEIVLRVNVEAKVEDLIVDIVDDVRGIMNA